MYLIFPSSRPVSEKREAQFPSGTNRSYWPRGYKEICLEIERKLSSTDFKSVPHRLAMGGGSSSLIYTGTIYTKVMFNQKPITPANHRLNYHFKRSHWLTSSPFAAIVMAASGGVCCYGDGGLPYSTCVDVLEECVTRVQFQAARGCVPIVWVCNAASALFLFHSLFVSLRKFPFHPPHSLPPAKL